MKCKECGRENTQGSPFCGGCGAKLPAPLTFDLSSAPPPVTPGSSPSGTASSANTAPTTQMAAQHGGHALVCTAGPDKGKHIVVGAQEITLGRSVESGLLSDDADVGEQHVAFVVQNGVLHFRALSTGAIYVDGNAQTGGALTLQSQLRIGRSFWQLETLASRANVALHLLDQLGERVSVVTGVSKIEGFSAQEMFSTTLAPRTDEDIEDYFLIGTRTTTPALKEVSTTWPKPWIFSRTFSAALLVYLGFYFAWSQFHNTNMLPGLMIMGAFAIPISLVIFFFETNAPRNVSIYQVIKLMLTGGVLALLATLLISTVITGSTANILGALLIGVAEETGKVLALMLVINKVKYRWTLNGLLFGSAVGAGFAGFESAGYSFGALLQTESAAPMLQSIVMRGLLAPGGHIVWTGLCGAALWKVKGNERFRTSMLQDIRFLRVFGLAIVLHGMWDMPINPPFFLKYIALTIIAWIAVLSFIQDGLKQVETAKSQQGSGGGIV